MKSRRRAREAALQALYQCDTLADWSQEAIGLYFEQFQSTPELEDSRALDFEEEVGEDSLPPAPEKGPPKACAAFPPLEYHAFALALVNGVCLQREQIESLITRASTHWSLARMARVDRNILRMAVYELLYSKEIPVGVVINEAIEIAKSFASADTPMFVNGVLDRIARELAGSELHEGAQKKLVSNG
jgi:transcription antitermination factor NusB